jgi:hypothetical protein
MFLRDARIGVSQLLRDNLQGTRCIANRLA